MGWDGGGWGMGFGPVSMLIWWIVVIVVLVAAIRWLGLTAGIGGAPTRRGDQALEILRERYARGEIGKEEFDAKRQDLGG
ncbi:MAG: SHOCT domain-containing protein [Candidatus Rokubacteria bacterium]|nr:SHOCT domain-containing protein [Candidatus Rokubacteria bacterium]